MILKVGDIVTWQQALPYFHEVVPMAANICQDLHLKQIVDKAPSALYWKGYGPIRDGGIVTIASRAPVMDEFLSIEDGTFIESVAYDDRDKFYFIIHDFEDKLPEIKEPSMYPLEKQGFFANQAEALKWWQDLIDSGKIKELRRDKHLIMMANEYIQMGYLRAAQNVTVGKFVWIIPGDRAGQKDKGPTVFPDEKEKVSPPTEPTKITPQVVIPVPEVITPPKQEEVVPPEKETVIPPAEVEDSEKEQIEPGPISKKKRKRKARQTTLELVA